MAPSPSVRTARSSWPASVSGAALTALAHPVMWPVALAGFLARGGIFALLLPIVVLPTPSGIADVIAPALTSFAFGVVSSAFIAIIAVTGAFVAAWVLLGGLAGAWADVELVREAVEEAAEDDEVGATLVDRRHLVLRALAVRLLASVPLAFALALGAAAIVNAAYAELTTPFEVVTPLFVRVLGDVPAAIAVVVAAWALCEAAGGLAVRHVLLRGQAIVPALRDGWLDLVRRPLSSIGTLVVTDVAVIAAVVACAVAAGAAWSWARFEMLDRNVATGAVAVVVLVAVWLAGLAVVSAVVAWRSVAWTAEAIRLLPAAPAPDHEGTERAVGTFGGREHARPGG
jgi:hypothetical protein